MKSLVARSWLRRPPPPRPGHSPACRAQAAAPQIGKQVPSIYRYKLGEFEITVLSDGAIKAPSRIPWWPISRSGSAEGARGRSSRRTRSATCSRLRGQYRQEPGAVRRRLQRQRPAQRWRARRQHGRGRHRPQDDRHGDHQPLPPRPHFRPAQQGGAASIPTPRSWCQRRMDVLARRRRDEQGGGSVEAELHAYQARVRPIAKDVKRFEFGKELVPGVTAVDARGHSPGHASFVIASGNAKLLYIADTTNNPALFARNPEWHLWADMDKAMAVGARKRLLDMAGGRASAIAGYHYPFPAVGCFDKQGNWLRVYARHLGDRAVAPAVITSDTFSGPAIRRPFVFFAARIQVAPFSFRRTDARPACPRPRRARPALHFRHELRRARANAGRAPCSCFLARLRASSNRSASRISGRTPARADCRFPPSSWT